ncbi:ATP-binding protein [uncultured Nostoc sp.]|uniref:ATP-binding protein n=1 Tax=uncultured Nostoc sp. TaxID=340711 RepID=UPI0035C9E069
MQSERSEYPVSFVRTLLRLQQSTKAGVLGLGVASLLLLPTVGLQNKGVGRLSAAVAGLACSLVGFRLAQDDSTLSAISEDLGIIDRKQSIAWYNGLLSRKQTLTVENIKPVEADIISDVVSYWQAEDKHLLIVGGTGAGKSTFVQAFASVLGYSWHYKIYDNDCTVDDWLYLRSLSSCSLFESYSSIGEQMQADLNAIEDLTQERKQAGNRWQPKYYLTVAEEMPALVDEIDCARDWIAKQAKRGRRVKRFVAVVAQNDTVKNLGLEGDSSLRDSCFVRVYLGQSAIDRAQLLKNTSLVDWLERGGKQVCLVDDKPALRPTSVQTHLLPTSQFNPSSEVETAEIPTESQCSDVQSVQQMLENSPLTGVYVTFEQVNALRELYQSGWSIAAILEGKLGQKRGGSWQKKKDWLELLLCS